MPIFNLQRYAPGEGFKQWHCDWTISDEATEPVHRVLAWILYCDTVEEAGTEFHWQNHHEPAERGKLVIFPAGPSHIHRGRVNSDLSKALGCDVTDDNSILTLVMMGGGALCAPPQSVFIFLLKSLPLTKPLDPPVNS